MTIEQKRNELAAVNSQINKITKITARQIAKMNVASKKMLLANLNDLHARKIALLNEIAA